MLIDKTLHNFIARPLLVVTDKGPTLSKHRPDPQTQFICFDFDIIRQLRASGRRVYEIPEAEMYSDYELFYRQYEFAREPDFVARRTSTLEGLLKQQITMRTSELYAPILHIWDVIATAVNRNPGTAIVTDISDPSFRTIVHDLLEIED